MKVGIVGSSKATNAINYIIKIINNHPGAIIVSGGSTGVDRTVKEYCKGHNIPYKEEPPDKWERDSFLARNRLIAKQCDIVYSIARPGRYCYHCHGTDHEKTAGCYTAIRCKKYKILVLPN